MRLAWVAVLAMAFGCSRAPSAPQREAMPVSAGVPGCARVEVEAALREMQALAMRRDLVMKQIQAYPANEYYEDNLDHDLRIFGELARSANEVTVPPCLAPAKGHFVSSIELSKEAYDKRRPGRERSEFLQTHARAKSAHDQYIAEAHAQHERSR